MSDPPHNRPSDQAGAAGRGPRRWEGPRVGRGDRRGCATNDQGGELVATVEALDGSMVNSPPRGEDLVRVEAGELVATIEALDGLVVNPAAGRGPRRWEGRWVGQGERRGRRCLPTTRPAPRPPLTCSCTCSQVGVVARLLFPAPDLLSHLLSGRGGCITACHNQTADSRRPPAVDLVRPAAAGKLIEAPAPGKALGLVKALVAMPSRPRSAAQGGALSPSNWKENGKGSAIEPD